MIFCMAWREQHAVFRYFLSRFILVKAYEDQDVEKLYGLQGYPTRLRVGTRLRTASTTGTQ